jgi:hypothetical protein
MVALSSIVHILHQSHQATDKYLRYTRRPAEPLVASLESQLIRLPHTRYDRHRDGPPSSWLRIVCRNRDVFQGTCLIRVDPTSRRVTESLLVLLAIQTPFEVLFQRLHYRDPLAELQDGGGRGPPLPAAHFEHLLRTGSEICCTDLDVAIDTTVDEWFLLSSVSSIAGGWLASDEALVPWCVFVRDMVAADEVQDALAKAKARPRQQELPDWARQWLGAPPASVPGDGSAHPELVVPVEVDPLTAEQEEVVELELAQMRAWLQGLLPAESHHFLSACLVASGLKSTAV